MNFVFGSYFVASETFTFFVSVLPLVTATPAPKLLVHCLGGGGGGASAANTLRHTKTNTIAALNLCMPSRQQQMSSLQ